MTAEFEARRITVVARHPLRPLIVIDRLEAPEQHAVFQQPLRHREGQVVEYFQSARLVRLGRRVESARHLIVAGGESDLQSLDCHCRPRCIGRELFESFPRERQRHLAVAERSDSRKRRDPAPRFDMHLRGHMCAEIRPVEPVLHRDEELDEQRQRRQGRKRPQSRLDVVLRKLEQPGLPFSLDEFHRCEMVERFETGFPSVGRSIKPRVESLHDVEGIVVITGPDMEAVLDGAPVIRHVAPDRRFPAEAPSERVEGDVVRRPPRVLLGQFEGCRQGGYTAAEDRDPDLVFGFCGHWPCLT